MIVMTFKGRYSGHKILISSPPNGEYSGQNLLIMPQPENSQNLIFALFSRCFRGVFADENSQMWHFVRSNSQKCKLCDFKG